MGRFKEVFIYSRNSLALVFSWLIICTIIYGAISGMESVTIAFLWKVLLLSLWAVISFSVCFKIPRLQKKGFIFQLTCFYLMFIPVEIGLFYYMGMFNMAGSFMTWIIFVALVIVSYLISLIIDFIVMRRRAVLYTQKINDYVSGNKSEV